MLLFCVWASCGWANAPDRSLRPVARPVSTPAVDVAPTLPVIIHSRFAVAQSPRPKARAQTARVRSQVAARPQTQTAPITLQDIFGTQAVTSPTPVTAGPARLVLANVPGVARSLRPQVRPASLGSQSTQPRTAIFSARGSVCGDSSIRGQRISSIAGRLPGCGVSDPVKITEVDGIKLSRASTMDCETAKSIKTWINEGIRPAVGRTGGGVESLNVAAHYICRTRNHQPGAKISEHGKGRAIDISSIVLADGSQLSVLNDWNNSRRGRILKQIHRSACGPFGTVLGPDADRYHKDHFHLDTARYRNGPYCR